MSSMWQSDRVVAVVVSDLHLSHKRPSCRMDDWYGAMLAHLQELQHISSAFSVPVVCSGDVFDRWSVCPELINFAIEHIPRGMICIPGQHDLPYHNYDDLKRSAYWTLEAAGVIDNLPPGGCCSRDDMNIWAFPFGFEIVSPKVVGSRKKLRVAMLHRYTHTPETAYPEAPANQSLKALHRSLAENQYDVVLIGDNHRHFNVKIGNCTYYNCGAAIRRRTNDSHPVIGLLRADGTVDEVKSKAAEKDIISPILAGEESSFHQIRSADALFEKLLISVSDDGCDFVRSLKRMIESLDESAEWARLLLKVLDD